MTLDLFSFLNEEVKEKEVAVQDQVKETAENTHEADTSEVNNVITLPSKSNSSEEVTSNELTDEEIMLAEERKKYGQEMMKQKQAEQAAIRGDAVAGTFGMDENVDAEEEGTPTSNSTPVSAKSTGTKKKETPTFDVDLSTFIRYGGQDIPLTTYFTEEEITVGIRSVKKGEEVVTKLTEEHLRKKMEDEYCELVKDLTSMNFVKNKNMIVPLLQAKKKGNNDCSQAESILDSASYE